VSARGDDARGEVRLVGVGLVVDERGQQAEVDVAARAHVLVHRRVGDLDRLHRVPHALAVARGDLAERAAEREREPAHRAGDVGDEREAGAADVLEEQHRRALLLLELHEDRRGLVARIDLAIDLDPLDLPLGPDALEEVAEVAHGARC
jgi:hypothetical protein